MHIWFLLTAIGAEVLATSSLRAATAAAAAWIWWVIAVCGYGASFALFFAALRHGAPLAESYAVWAGRDHRHRSGRLGRSSHRAVRARRPFLIRCDPMASRLPPVATAAGTRDHRT